MTSAQVHPTVYLHIGLPKSGTTYLQSRFETNHDLAAEQGLLWPGPGWGRHVRAVGELRELAAGASLAPSGPWRRLTAEALGWEGSAVLISMEWLVGLTPHQIETAVASLAPARVELICTARDLLRSFVAQGQEMARNYRVWPWQQIEEELLHDAPGQVTGTFWTQQDLPRILQRWSAAVPVERMHLVTVPPAGGDPELLWRRFCAVLGIDGSGFRAAESVNESLGVVSTVLMQRLNVVAAARGLPHDVYKRVLHRRLAHRILTRRRDGEGPIALGEEMDGFLRERAESEVERTREMGVSLVGDWDDLLPGPPLEGRRPQEVSEAELLQVCMEALVSLGVEQDAAAARRAEARARAAEGREGRPQDAPRGRRVRGLLQGLGRRR